MDNTDTKYVAVITIQSTYVLRDGADQAINASTPPNAQSVSGPVNKYFCTHGPSTD